MAFQLVKGTRDFYPEQMAFQNWIFDAWRRVSIRNGFVEFDGPVLEYLDLYRAKSGDEIVSQLFSLTDRGGRELALRPEITPTLARMVNAKINSLPRPVKWFSIPRVWRAENPQKGRLRELFQWNIDIIGGPDALSDAECVFTAVDLLAEVGLTSAEVQVRYSSRRLLAEVLRLFGVAPEAGKAVLGALDKRGKIPPAAFDELFALALPDAAVRAGVGRFLNFTGIDSATDGAIAAEVGVAFSDECRAALADIRQFQAALKSFGIDAWCRYDTNIVRGLAYYTGIVYEIFDSAGEMRAVAGGGRYDNLLEVLGGPKVGATGFGMGDVVLGILLTEKGKAPNLSAKLDCFVLTEAEALAPAVLSLVGQLRRANIITDFSAKTQNIGKGLKDANRRNARFAAIVKDGGVALKDLRTGEQADIPAGELIAELKRRLGSTGL
jgi:histidyl-tRNA synthetase